jgi:serine/threonine-protein kinase RsbW
MLEKKQIIELKSALTEIHLVEKFVEDICDEYNINNSYFGNILIALTEAVENAMHHGNNDNPDKKVIIVFESKPVGLSFLVKDEGPGFNYKTISDPTDLSENIDPNKGRGLFLMKSLADEINFCNTGNSIELVFKISSINSELSADRISQLKQYEGIKTKQHHENN